MTTPPFPNAPTPSYYRTARWNTAPDKRNGIHYVGDTVTINFSALASTTTYEVRDYFGTVLSSGSISSGATSFTPTVPSGGWQPGWYRVYLSQATNDTNFAFSAGATNFCVVRNDSHFLANPAGNTVGGYNDQFNDLVGKGVLGIGTSRLVISDAANYTTGGATLAEAELELALTNTYWVAPGAPYADSLRPRYAWCQFPNGGYDYIQLMANSGASIFGWVTCATGSLDGSQVFVEVVNGTNPGTAKINVYYPTNVTLVETYDNLNRSDSGTACATVNASSTKIHLGGYNGTPLDNLAKTAIGNSYFNGVAAVVADLYPLGCTYFEGPQNEPFESGVLGSPVANWMMLFQAAVHAGNSSAKAIGPCFVSIDWSGTQGWYDFFNAGGHNYCDELSFHAYNSQTNGDINLGRSSWQKFSNLMQSFGVSKTLWQTESVNVFDPVYGIYHPRRSRIPILMTLLSEQFGVTKERGNYWYDWSHGFWAYPAWWENGDTSVEPMAVMFRVMAELIWGKPYAYDLDFGPYGNRIFIGNVYTGTAGSTVAVMATSYLDTASVTFSTNSAGPLTITNGLGQTSSVTPSQGRFTLTFTDIPQYISLPVGESLSVYSVNNWSVGSTQSSISSTATTREIDGVSYTQVGDDGWMTDYANGTGIAPTTFATPASVVKLLWGSSQRIQRLLIWCGPAWQDSGTLITFTVDTTTDGTNFTTRKTVNKGTPTYLTFGTADTNSACFLETYWDEQWVFDVLLDVPITCTGIRLNVSSASYGGEPLSTTTFGTAFGQGNANQAYRIQEVAVFTEPTATTAGRQKRPKRLGRGGGW